MAKIRSFPFNFVSFEAFSSYLRCMNKAKSLDTAYIYLRKNAYDNLSPSNKLEDVIHPVCIIGIKKNSVGNNLTFLLGTNDLIGFWDIHRDVYNEVIYNTKLDLSKYKFGYWANASCCKIARLER